MDRLDAVSGAAVGRSDAGGDTLRVGSENGQLRHWLAGRQVRHWDVLEVHLADRSWLTGRYEWTGRPEHDPALIVELAGSGDAWRREAQLLLPIGAELRWAEPAGTPSGGDAEGEGEGEADSPTPGIERSRRRKGGGGARSRKVIDVRDDPAPAPDPVSESDVQPPMF